MLQCGGGNNSSSALLKQYFASEKACQLNALSATQKYRTSGGGILPCPTPLTDLNSIKKAALHQNKHPALVSPRSQQGQRGASQSPRAVPKPPVLKPLDASNASSQNALMQSSGSSPVHNHSKPTSPRIEGGSPRSLSHGRTGPFGRRNMEKEFFDTVSTGHIACLSLPAM